jgi:hypothetical protein
MSNPNGGKPHWQLLYESAAAENDRNKLTALVGHVEEAMMMRAQELAHDADHSDERHAMAQASKNLLVIKTEKLSYPPISMR